MEQVMASFKPGREISSQISFLPVYLYQWQHSKEGVGKKKKRKEKKVSCHLGKDKVSVPAKDW